MTPMDIVNREFRKAVRGYNLLEVDRFLEVVSQDYELLFKDNYELKEKLEQANRTLEQYRQIESTLHNTMVLAQQTSEDVRHNANREAELIIERARSHAEELLTEARQKVDRMLFEYEELRRQYDSCRSQFRTFLLTHLKIAETQEKADTHAPDKPLAGPKAV